MIPMLEDRRKICEIVENLSLMLDFYWIDESNHDILNYYLDNFNSNKYPHHVWEYLMQLNFFSRFSKEQLNLHVFPKMKLKKYFKDDVIYTDDMFVSIILSGEALLYSHKGRVYPSKLISRFK